MQPPILLELGNLQLVAHRLDSARLLLRQGLAAVQAPYSGPAEASLLHVGLAQVALAAQRPAQALPEARLALRQAQQVGNPETQADALLAIAQAEQALHQPAAYATLAQYLALHDTLTNQAQAEAVITAQARFQAHEQQTQIRTLQQDRRLAAQTQELTRLRTRQQQAGGAALLLAVLAGAGGLLWRYRRRQAAREMALRQRLAADLHDDVGSLLTQISMQSSLLREAPHSPAQTLARLESLAATSRQAAQQMSDVVWGLGTEGLTLHQLLARMRDHAQEVLPPAGLDVEFRVPPDLPDSVLPPLLRHHLYLIYKEALHNVVKHAGASLVTVGLAHTPAGLALTVADNGRGHDGTPRPGGHGLPSMQARAEALGGTLAAGPAGGGFEVRLALPG